MKKTSGLILALGIWLLFPVRSFAYNPMMISAGAGRVMDQEFVITENMEDFGEMAGEAVNEMQVEAGQTVAEIMDIHEEIPEGSVISEEELHRREALAIVTGTPVDDGTVAGYINLGLAKVDNWLNVREKPAEDAELVGKMPKNAGCEILALNPGAFAGVKRQDLTAGILGA